MPLDGYRGASGMGNVSESTVHSTIWLGCCWNFDR